jgi:alpha-glucoside transport system permease protein
MGVISSSVPQVRLSSRERWLSRRMLGRVVLHVVVISICAIWLIPTLSLVVSSLRSAALLLSSGWWHVFASPG